MKSRGHVSLLVPSEVTGTLKKRRYILGVPNYQQRFIVLDHAYLEWWLSEEEASGKSPEDARGFVNFVGNSCLVRPEEEQNVFSIRPRDKYWADRGPASRKFTGPDDRVIYFCTDGSELDRDQWLDAMQEHINYGNSIRLAGGIQMSTAFDWHKTAAVDRGGGTTVSQMKVSPTFSGAKLRAGLSEKLSPMDFSLARYALEQWPPEKIAVKTCGRNMSGPLMEISYGELRKAAYFGANLLFKGGLRKGHKALLLQWNSWDCVAAYWSVHYIGAVTVMAIPTHVERKYLIKYTSCVAVFAPYILFERLQKEIDDRTLVKLLLLTDLPPEGVNSLPTECERSPCKVDSQYLDDCFDFTGQESYQIFPFDGSGRSDALDNDAKAEHFSIRRHDECLWYFTSGTTGKPKGCMHRQHDLAFAAETYGLCMGCKEGAVTATDVLMAGPYAMGSNLLFPLTLGCTVFLDHIDKTDNTGMPEISFPIIRKSRCTVFVSIPGTIQALARALWTSPDQELIDALKSCSIITSAGAPLCPATYTNMVFAARHVGLNIDVLDGIGTSELQHIFISNMVGDVKSQKGCIGKLVEGYQARLLNAVAEDTEQGISWKGELMVRTMMPDIVVAYSNERPPKGTDYRRATDEANLQLCDDGAPWYITGDIAVATKENDSWYFYLLGRTKDLSSQISEGAERHMGLEDYKRKAIANEIIMCAGQLESARAMCEALRVSSNENLDVDVIVDDVFPIEISQSSSEVCVYMLSVTPTFWPEKPRSPEDTEQLIAEMTAFIKQKLGDASDASQVPLIFAQAHAIPRTGPPLLKPKPGEMKVKLQAAIDEAGITNLDSETCVQLSCGLRLD